MGIAKTLEAGSPRSLQFLDVEQPRVVILLRSFMPRPVPQQLDLRGVLTVAVPGLSPLAWDSSYGSLVRPPPDTLVAGSLARDS